MSNIDPPRDVPPRDDEGIAPHAEARSDHPQRRHHEEGKGFLQSMLVGTAMFWPAVILFIVAIVVIIVAFNVW